MSKKDPQAEFKTSMGTFTVEFFADKMPYTCAAIIDLIEKKYYDGLHFHRVIKNFMLQFGCPKSKDPKSPYAGTGGPAPNSEFKGFDGKTYSRDSGGNIQDEHTAQISNKPYTLSMANTGQKNSGGSQFFINSVHNAYLDWFSAGKSQHPVFAHVIKGKDVIDKIGNVQTNQRDGPSTSVKMVSVTML
mmetsp:Transcript_4228/g.6538  ORF Transcript_4228/g.6538 Transcript_4228/m.6538 type:complete len:188 (+) Transcript_4228:136-699(+)